MHFFAVSGADLGTLLIHGWAVYRALLLVMESGREAEERREVERCVEKLRTLLASSWVRHAHTSLADQRATKAQLDHLQKALQGVVTSKAVDF